MKRLAIIAALEREVAGLVRGWTHTVTSAQNRSVHIYESDAALVAFAGIGVINARIAAAAAYAQAQGNVAQFISAGLAGALVPELETGDIVTPRLILDEVDGGQIEAASGEGTLVTASSITGADAKRALATRHAARAVDMEAYAVADVARIYGVPFIAVKAISDRLDFPMPPLSRFVSDNGQFQTAKFALYTALRPWTMPAVLALGRHSALASERLTAYLRGIVQQHAAGLYNSSNPEISTRS